MNPRPTGRYVKTTVAGESVRAFVPNPLPPKLPVKALAALEKPLQAAHAALEKLDLAGQMIPSLDWFIYAFVRKEALLSSEIEGTQATLVDVLTYEQTEQTGSSSIEDVEEVTNYVQAINYALQQIGSKRGLPVSIRLLNECHRQLMKGVRGANKDPGELRKSQNWIGGSRPGNAVFVPPPPNLLSDLLGDLEKYIHEDDELSPLLRTAAVHVQIETIHPYLDGNGRVGRMLIAMLLAHWELLTSPLLYLSVFFRERQREYYDRLGAVRTEGDWAGWFEFFLGGVQLVANNGAMTAGALNRQVSTDRTRLLALDSVTVSAIQLFELLPKHPVVSMPLVTRLLNTTKPTAGKSIELLQRAGIVTEIGERKRDRLYSYQLYLNLLKS